MFCVDMDLHVWLQLSAVRNYIKDLNSRYVVSFTTKIVVYGKLFSSYIFS